MSTERTTETEYARQKKTAMRREIFIGGLSIVCSLLMPASAMIGLSISGPASLALNISLSLWILSGLGAIAGWAIAALATFKPTPVTQKLFAGLVLIAIAALTAFLCFYNGPSILSFIVNQLRIVNPDMLRPNELAIGFSIASVVLSCLLSFLSGVISWGAQSEENSQTPASAPELRDTASLAKENSPAPAPELRHTASLEKDAPKTPLPAQLPNREHDRGHGQESSNLLASSHSTLLTALTNAPAAAPKYDNVYPNLLDSRFTLLKAPTPAVAQEINHDALKPHDFSPTHYGSVS